MAHNLAEKDGKVSMMYVGQEPWHGLGTKLAKAATSEEAIVAAGLDYAVEKRPIYYTITDAANAAHRPIADKFATVRMDTKEALGVVGSQYRPLQNKEAFSFFDAVVGLKEAIYHTAGALGKGETVWLLAKLPGEIKVIGHDVSEKFLLLTNSHDGSGSIKVLFTPIRVVCQNTLNVALSTRENAFSIRHTPGMGLKVEEAQKALGIVNARFELFQDAARKLATTELTVKASQAFFTKVANRYGEAPELAKGQELPAKTKAIIEEMTRLFEGGRGAELKGAKGTAWGAFNAVAEFVDFYRPTRSGDVSAIRASRADSLLFGTGKAMKQRAWDEALALAK